MHDRAAVAAAPQADTQPERQPARPNGVERLIALELARRPTPVRGLQRCGAGGCTCGGACGGRGHDEENEDELRMGAQALQRAVADRRMVARDGQDPGPPRRPTCRAWAAGSTARASGRAPARPARDRSSSTPSRCLPRRRPRCRDGRPRRARPTAGTGPRTGAAPRASSSISRSAAARPRGRRRRSRSCRSVTAVGAPAAVVARPVRRAARAGAAPEGRLPAAGRGSDDTPELGDERRELAPDQRDVVDVARAAGAGTSPAPPRRRAARRAARRPRRPSR